MAVKSTFIGNTAWVGELETASRKDSSGNPYTAKSILFRVATRREYTINKEVNGEQIKERPTDFISCKATGHVAQLIKDYASSVKADGKLQSRVVELSGHFETYKTKKEDKKVIERVEKRRINVNGQIYEIDVPISVESVHEVEYWQTMFMVDSINFWDSNVAPESTAVSAPAKTMDTTTVIAATLIAEDSPVESVIATTVQKVETVTETPVATDEKQVTESVAKITPDNEAPIVSIPSDILEDNPF